MQELDLLDHLIEDWQRERPDLDCDDMGVVGRIILLGTRLKTSANEALKPFDLSYTELDLLATLRRSGAPYQLTPSALMKAILLSSGAMTAALKRLEKRGLITRSDNVSGDKRVKTVALSDKGLELINRAIETRFKEAEEAVAAMPNQKKAELEKLLRTLLVSMS